MKSTTAITDNDLRRFRAALRALVRKLARQLRDETQCCGVGYLMCHVLLELEDGPGRSLKELEEALGTDKAALSRAVDFLVKDGLVSRKENAADRRALVLALTAAGRKRVAEINAYSDGKYRDLFRLIPAREQATVICAVGHLARAFDELCGETGACAPATRRKT